MNRRELLATFGAGAGILSSGCTGLGGETDLRADVRDDGDQTHVVFLHGDEEPFHVTISVRPDGRRYGRHVRVNTWQADHRRYETFRFGLRVPAHGTEPRTRIVLETPDGSGYQSFRFYRARDDARTAVAEMPDTGAMGEGSIPLDFVVVPLEDDFPDEAAVEIDAELSDGSRFSEALVASERLTVPLQ